MDQQAQTQASKDPSQLTALTLRGAGQMFDMQLSAMRTFFETQARTAAAFGFPDCSGMFPEGAGDRMREAVSTSAERLLGTTQRAQEAAAEIQRQVGRIVESQTQTAAQTWQQGIEQIASRTDDSIKQLSATAQQQVEQIRRSSSEMGDAARDTMRQGGEQMQRNVQDGAERSRELISQAGDAQRSSVQGVANKSNSGDEKQKRA